MPLVLVGLMGSGKSVVGGLVAAHTHRVLFDVDVAITSRVGKSVRELWEAGGESTYRHLESEEVLDALRLTTPVVIAAPGGVVLDPAVRSAMGNAFVVWLRAGPATLARRVRSGDHRPLLADHPYEVLNTMAADRAHLYERVADAVVDTDDVDAASAATMVIELLGCLPVDA